MSEYPFPATIVVVDLRSFSKLRNPDQIAARRQLYGLLADAFTAGGVDWKLCAHEDRGDGVLVIVPTETPRAVLLGPVLTEFAHRVESAERLPSGWACQVRVAVQAGEVHQDENGFVGSDVNHAFRLVDSDVLREALSTTDRRCAVLVSDVLYQATVRHGYDQIDPNAFHCTVVHVKDVTATAWLSIPGDDAAARAVAARQRGPQRSDAQNAVGGNVTITDSNVSGRDQHIGDKVAGAKVGRDLINNQTFVEQVRRHPRAAILILLLLLLGVGWVGYALLSADDGGAAMPDNNSSSPDAGQPLRDPGILVGSWRSSDDTGTKVYSGNGGSCEGFYYHQGRVLDIGGQMTCRISSQPDVNGRYTFQVTQKPNQASYKITFDSPDQATIYGSDGAPIYRLSRF
ncbi:hypothetical protein DL991_37695 [Amycolatopsis sp. WAC 01375]|uniref:hypothetical protein n=1 Tax=Amycolatopsis sp. WAC 01375 TaxID=2203194 RepID=UPI000F7B2459|nr:hypothetical protein [Amycolatopsis sp. WAC 01375]RSM70395.1 hypothetical protein DL991_37695 [Amycolatopsis sp. WAC 01375]